MGKTTIAIDPDVERSGVAIIKDGELTLRSLPFPELVETIIIRNAELAQKGHSLEVFVEAGWLNSSNWHLGYRDTPRLAASKGLAVGRNQETGRKIIEMLEYYNIKVTPVKPLRKQWKGKDNKITHDELVTLCNHAKITYNGKRESQDARDAGLIAIVYK